MLLLICTADRCLRDMYFFSYLYITISDSGHNKRGGAKFETSKQPEAQLNVGATITVAF